jgi:hypothetical protein
MIYRCTQPHRAVCKDVADIKSEVLQVGVGLLAEVMPKALGDPRPEHLVILRPVGDGMTRLRIEATDFARCWVEHKPTPLAAAETAASQPSKRQGPLSKGAR